MTITLNVPTDVEAVLRAQAKAAGMKVEEYSARLLGQTLRSLPTETPLAEEQREREEARRARVHALRGAGASSGLTTEDFLREKHEENERREQSPSPAAPKKKTIADLKGYGKFADIIPSTEDLARHKQEEIEQEEARSARRSAGRP